MVVVVELHIELHGLHAWQDREEHEKDGAGKQAGDEPGQDGLQGGKRLGAHRMSEVSGENQAWPGLSLPGSECLAGTSFLC